MANDHYVPQFYLRNFQIPTKRRWIFQYRHQHQPEARAIRSVASIENYYTINTALNEAETESDRSGIPAVGVRRIANNCAFPNFVQCLAQSR